MYANKTIKSANIVDTGDTLTTAEFDFPGLSGIPYFSPTVAATAEHESYTTNMIDEAISDSNIHIFVGDDHNSKTMSGTIYVIPRNIDITFYFNPVYQSADGSIFVVAGDATSMSGMIGTGSIMTHTLDTVQTVTENGVTITDSFSASISINIMYTPEKIVITQMNADNLVISQTETNPGEVGETLSPEKDTAFIIVETHSRDIDGELIIIRELHNKGDDHFETFSTRADGICIKHWTQLIWE